jgi:transcriptional regulator with XRE-family HTH domain
VLSYYFKVPIGHFWGTETLSAKRGEEDLNERVPELLMLRQRIIGVRLRKLREDAGLTIAQVAERSEVDAGQIEQAERGQTALPVSQLETVVRAAQGRMDDLVDGHGMVGNWLQSQEQFEEFLRLSPELRDFVLKPVNQSYLDLAVRLSKMKVDELRSIAESILEITY